MQLLKTSPALIKQLLKEGVQRAHERKVAAGLWAEAGPAGRRACFDVVHRMTSVGAKQPDEFGKALVKMIAADSYWTTKRQREAGYEVE
eukprot:6781455-Lingulodinium_polyedra.AAC.1